MVTTERVQPAALRVLLVADKSDISALVSKLDGPDIEMRWPDSLPDGLEKDGLEKDGLEKDGAERDGEALFDLVAVDVSPASGAQHVHSPVELPADLPVDSIDTPVVALVANSAQGHAALGRGADGYAVKARLESESFRDIAYHAMEIRRMKRALHGSRERLIHADRLAAIGLFTAGVAHEINNPTASVLANLTALQSQLAALPGGGIGGVPPSDSDSADQIRDWVDILDESIEGLGHIRAIVGDLRRFSRSDSGAVGPVDLNQVIEAACRLTDGLIRRRAHLIKDLLASGRVWGDHGKLVQVFTNLLSNAAHAIDGSRAGNQIRVSSRVRDGRIVAAVEDTGAGIPASIRELIFEPFFTTKSHELGNGLGLAVSAEIIYAHGGEIDFVPLADGGTRFEVRLPMTEQTIQPGESQESHKDPAPLVRPVYHDSGHTAPSLALNSERPLQRGRTRILLIDDEPSLLRAFRRLLIPYHEVVMAATGQQALDILAGDTDFDGVICDFSMPDIDGISIYETVAARDRELADRIVFCTGGPVSGRGRRFIESTSNTVLDKPVPPERLLGAIEQLGKR